MNICVCVVSFYHAETPLALMKQHLITITRNTFWHCRVRLYAFIIQQIVTLSKYGHDALDICHP